MTKEACAAVPIEKLFSDTAGPRPLPFTPTSTPTTTGIKRASYTQPEPRIQRRRLLLVN